MKTYSIGREDRCDIVINDSTDVISRRHALLTVDSTGKMTITDQSHNGTYVNGIRISTNVPFPITRKDNVSFAQIARLDWKLVPDPTTIYKYSIAGVLGVVISGLLIWGGISLFGGSPEEDPVQDPVVEQNIQEDQEELERKEKARQDSINKVVQDSIRKANVKKPNKPTKPADSGSGSSNNKGKKTTKPAQTEQPITIR